MTSEEKKVKEVQLKAQYKVLSQVEEMWGVKPSRHRAYIFVSKKLREIIKELHTLKES